MPSLPSFDSRFLNNICRAIEGRTKALKHKGRLRWNTRQPDDFEWLTVGFTPTIGHYCTFQFADDNTLCVYVRSAARKDRGKVLLRIEDVHIVDDAPSVVAAMETTIEQSHYLHESPNKKASEAIRSAWSKVAIRLLDEPNSL